MNIFLDTSSLFKLYHREKDRAQFEQDLSDISISRIFLSQISKIEFASLIWKKVRTNEINEFEARKTLELFETDFLKYNFKSTDNIIVEEARRLTSKYGMQGLRTLDSIQLSTAVSLFPEVEIFFTADRLLNSLFALEGLPTSSKNT